jgi:hypothetical protein
MLIGGSDGFGWRYEVLAREDGFLVQMRDLDTGEIDQGEARLFRTAAVAFAQAEALAAIDRYASAAIVDEPTDDLLAEAEVLEQRFFVLRRTLGDDGAGLTIYATQVTSRRPVFH